MTFMKRDPLLTAAKILLVLLMGLVGFVAVMLLVGLGVVLVGGPAEVLVKVNEAGAPDSVYWAITAAIVLIELIMLAVLRFLWELRGIVTSVDRGDPFVPENARRLSRMGWLTVAGYAIGIVLGGLLAWIERVAGDTSRIDVDYSFDGGGGIILILVLFILARVFRHGAAMREELEGTV